MGLKKVAECVKKNKIFVITAHTRLEGDALGSELALCHLLKKMGKKAVIINEDAVPERYRFLPGVDKIKRFNRKIRNIDFDCLALVDCSDLKRCGNVSSINVDNKPILNIDHHISNVKFGKINWVDPIASSCCEMIFRLYKELRIAFDKDSAIFLYVGILTDTGSFRYTNTGGLTHQAVAELFKYKLDINKIYKYIYENISVGEFRMLTKILPKLKFQHQGKIVWFRIEDDLIKDAEITLDMTETVLNFARAIKGVEVAVAFKRNFKAKDEIRVNLRSQGKIDVNKIAKYFSGGGHRTASGCTITGGIETATSRVLKKIRESIK